MTFTGIPHAAADFYAELETSNTREWWEAHRERYDRDVRGPMSGLAEALAEEFGEAKVFRPHRDVRFSADKTPFKTHQGIFVATGERTGYYAEVSADGFRVGGGTYHLDAPALKAYRQAVDAPAGAELERIVGALREAGWEITGEQLKTAPRGVDRDHPRLELLRHKAIAGMRWVEDGDIVTTPRLVEEVTARWRELRPLVSWLNLRQG